MFTLYFHYSLHFIFAEVDYIYLARDIFLFVVVVVVLLRIFQSFQYNVKLFECSESNREKIRTKKVKLERDDLEEGGEAGRGVVSKARNSFARKQKNAVFNIPYSSLAKKMRQNSQFSSYNVK